MAQISSKEFAVLMGMMGVAFGIDPSGDKMAVYYAYLKDLPAERLHKAADRLIKTRKYSSFPTIAEIREVAGEMVEADLDDRARVAWEKAKAVLIAGPNGADPILDLAVKLAFGGWDRFGETDEDNEASDRKHFISCYKLAARETIEQRLLPTELKKELEETRRRISELDPERRHALPAPEPKL